jgi:alginate O-acetyltransferase complex protein AlgI
MGFVSFEFLALLAIGAWLYRLVPRPARPAFLALASYAFYLTWNARMAVALFALTLLVFLAARRLQDLGNHPAARLLAITVSVLVAYLGVFKAAEALHRTEGVIIPLGVSYYTFKLISYVIDVYWRTVPAETNFINFAAYVAFFPQIVAGPIQRAPDFLLQMRQAQLPGKEMLWSGVGRILLGCFKKLAVADPLAVLVHYGFAHAAGSAGLPRLMAFYVFPLQLLADFSALTDIAIGAGRLLGIESPENFDAPYFAVTISAFWRRFHMTLTQWLRDYVFTPLRMRWRNWGNLGLAASLTVNMVLIGLWHGVTLPFVVFGLIHSVYLSVDALTTQFRKKWYRQHPRLDTVTTWLGPILVFHLVCFGAVFFGARSLTDAFRIVTRLYSGVAFNASAIAASINPVAWTGLGGYALAEVLDFLRRRKPEPYIAAAPRWIRWSAASCAVAVALFFLAVLLARQTAVNPFVYAIF